MSHFVWNVDPVLISLGPITIHWYGALFASAIFAGLYYMKWVFSLENRKAETLDNLLMYVVLGIIIGARLGHCFFYDPDFYFANPLKILAIWEGGLASHGGGLGAILATWLFCKRNNLNTLWLLDRLAIATAVFGIFVRSANFVNSEILGHPSDVPWAIVFERVDTLARHPAQLYEAMAYLLIAVVLTVLYRSTAIKERIGALLGLFLILTFSARFIIEFFKQQQASYTLESALNTGQMLSIPFFFIGIFLFVRAKQSSHSTGNQ